MSHATRNAAGAWESECFINLRCKITANMLGPNRKYLPRFVNMHSVLREKTCFRSLWKVMKLEEELPMLVAPASRLFSTSSFTAVPRFSTTCPEQMRLTETRSIGRMAPAGCGLGTEGQQTTASERAANSA